MPSNNWLPLILLLASSFALSFSIIFILKYSSLKKYFADAPDYRKVHQQVVPRLGGLGIILAFLLTTALQRLFFAEYIVSVSEFCFTMLFFVSIFLLIGGSLDDIKTINYKIKFLMQFILAAVVVTDFNIRFEHIHLFDQTISLGIFGTIISIIWLVAVMNALNIIDGIDGLASCVTIISFITVAILANASQQWDIVAACVILTGATVGFLIHNMILRQKVFLGDTGALFLGAILGILSIMVTRFPGNEYPFFVPILIVGYPLFDISVAMVRRFAANLPDKKRHIHKRFLKMFEADNEHLHHRLVHWGLSHLQTTFLLSLVAATMGSAAIIISRINLGFSLVIIGYLSGSLVLILNRLGYFGKGNWLHFPRQKEARLKLIGVIEPEEVFLYSLKNYEQSKLEFFSISVHMSHQLKSQFSAILVNNRDDQYFQRDYQSVLRAAEIHNCPVFFISRPYKLRNLSSLHHNLKSVIFIEKPVRIPDLLQQIEDLIRQWERASTHHSNEFEIPEWLKKEIHA